jgi:hypothetical protein
MGALSPDVGVRESFFLGMGITGAVPLRDNRGAKVCRL